MELAIRSARSGMRRGEGGPFGASIVNGRRVVAVAHNTVLATQDPTAHAEINALRAAARKLKTFDLRGHVMVSSTEPCPMCFSAIHWARLDRVVYGTRIADVQRRGFHELALSCRRLARLGRSRVKITSGFMERACRRLLEAWDGLESKQVY